VLISFRLLPHLPQTLSLVSFVSVSLVFLCVSLSLVSLTSHSFVVVKIICELVCAC